jgi:hypothetical protein
LKLLAGSAGVSLAFLPRVKLRKIAGETPAPRKPASFAESLYIVLPIKIVMSKKS